MSSQESFLPWWLILLLGMWAVALAIWQTVSIHREIRLWSGLATLVYLGLIFLALTISSRSTESQGALSLRDRMSIIGSLACIVISLTAGVWLMGRASLASRRISYVLLTFANAALCVLMGELELAVSLAIVALVSGRLPRGFARSRFMIQGFRGRCAELVRIAHEPMRQEDAGRFWLTCLLNGILACAIIGTVGYSLRVETARIAQSPRYSALPARDQIVPSTAGSNDSARATPLFEFASGARADLIVLLAVVVFLCLATTMNDSISFKQPPSAHAQEFP